MDYPQAITWLYDCQQRGIKLGLENTRKLLGALGVDASPAQRIRYIHVAGTNGKGSVCAMLDAICRKQGFRTGLFTSPHLITFRERIQIDGEMIDENGAATGLSKIHGIVSDWETHPTFFEITTALALEYFQCKHVDVAVLETGMGGRLDATNAIWPAVSVITPIDLDHQAWLGSTLAAIAAEKAGIIKPGVPVVSSPQREEVAAVLRSVAPDICFVTKPLKAFPIALAGSHQEWNAALAVEALRAAQFAVDERGIRLGLQTVSWPGRFQVVAERFVLDGAHNEAAARQLAQIWKEKYDREKATVILGILSDKDLRAICRELMPVGASFIATRVRSPRSFSAEEVAADIKKVDPTMTYEIAGPLAAAISAARSRPGRILITGSLFLVGEALSILDPGRLAPEFSSQ